MEITENGFIASDDKTLIQPNRVRALLNETYWAAGRDIETVKKSIDFSLCAGVYRDGEQIGFARCVTDYATVFWLCDVVIDDAYRGLGLGKLLMRFMMGHPSLKPLLGILGTKDAHGLYEQYGFKRSPSLMRKDVGSYMK